MEAILFKLSLSLTFFVFHRLKFANRLAKNITFDNYYSLKNMTMKSTFCKAISFCHDCI